MHHQREEHFAGSSFGKRFVKCTCELVRGIKYLHTVVTVTDVKGLKGGIATYSSTALRSLPILETLTELGWNHDCVVPFGMAHFLCLPL